MGGKTIFRLLAILIVLAGIGILFESNRNRQTHVSQATVFHDLKVDQVDRIKILWNKKETVLEKKGDKWVVATEGGHAAEPKYVSDILERLPKYYSDEVVSTNPANQSLFQVDSSGVEVWVNQNGKEIGHFYVGKPGPDFLSTYVRPAGSNKVILVPDYLPYLFQRGESWRERTIFDLKDDDVRNYEYASPTRGQVVLRKDDSGGWHMDAPDTGRVQDDRIKYLVHSFATLKAAGFADSVGSAVAGIDADTSHIVVTLASGSKETLRIGLPTGANRNYARREGSDQIFVIPRGAVNTMMPPAATLKTAGVDIQIPGEASSPR